MAQQIINVGSSPNKGDGDPLRTAFNKVNENFTDLYAITADIQNGVITLSATVQGDVQGSIFGDDSSIIVDGVSGEIRGDVNNNRVTTNIIETGSITANSFVGSVFADDSTMIIDGQTGEVTGTFIGSLTGTVLGSLDGDVTGSVFGDDSTPLVDGVGNTINLNRTIKGQVTPSITEVFDLGSTTHRFKDLYLSGSSIDLGGLKLSNDAGLKATLNLTGGEAFAAGWWDTQWWKVGPKTGGPEIKVRIDDVPSDADNQAWIAFLRNIKPGDVFNIQTPLQQNLVVTSTVVEDHFTSTKFRFYFGVDVAPPIVGDDMYVYLVSTDFSPANNLSIKYTPATQTDWPGGVPTTVDGALDQLAGTRQQDIIGSVFADDSTVLVDAVSGTIPGYISLQTLKTEVAASADFADFQARIAAL